MLQYDYLKTNYHFTVLVCIIFLLFELPWISTSGKVFFFNPNGISTEKTYQHGIDSRLFFCIKESSNISFLHYYFNPTTTTLNTILIDWCFLMPYILPVFKIQFNDKFTRTLERILHFFWSILRMDFGFHLLPEIDFHTSVYRQN